MATETTIKRILGLFLAVYPIQKNETDILEPLREIWIQVLSDLPDRELQMAANDFLRSPAEWRPPPGKLRTRALEICGQTSEARALSAWERYGDIDDDEMTRQAKTHNDEIALRSIAQMRARQRWFREEETDAQRMAERRRLFMEAYASFWSSNPTPLPEIAAGESAKLKANAGGIVNR
jgi:hypothetical protein